jgi:hypothetical protein
MAHIANLAPDVARRLLVSRGEVQGIPLCSLVADAWKACQYSRNAHHPLR